MLGIFERFAPWLGCGAGCGKADFPSVLEAELAAPAGPPAQVRMPTDAAIAAPAGEPSMLGLPDAAPAAPVGGGLLDWLDQPQGLPPNWWGRPQNQALRKADTFVDRLGRLGDAFLHAARSILDRVVGATRGIFRDLDRVLRDVKARV